ncbi:MAG: hypothetical protein SO434_04525 [Eubacteriales bacterium]|nr:hypothetical protein [Eubacteriales bacterium]
MKKYFILVIAITLVCMTVLFSACLLMPSDKDNQDNGKIKVDSSDFNVTSIKAEPVAISTSAKMKVKDSYTDGQYNYYLINVGYIKNMYMSTLAMVEYNGNPIDFSETVTTTATYMESLTYCVENSITFSKSNSNSVGIEIGTEIGFGKNNKFKISGQYTWEGVDTNSSSTNTSKQDTTQKADSFARSQVCNFSLGKGDKEGCYRYAIYATCDVYFNIKTSKDNANLLLSRTEVCSREGTFKVRSEYSADGEFDNTPISKISISEDFYKDLPIPTKKTNKPTTDFVTKELYNDIIRSGEYKVRGSGKICDATFQLNDTISNLKKNGYNRINFNIDYQLREQDECWIFVNLYDEYNNSIYYRKVEHGGTTVNRNYSMYNIDIEVDIETLESHNFRIEFKAENKMWKDFYVGTVKGKVTAIKTEE